MAAYGLQGFDSFNGAASIGNFGSDYQYTFQNAPSWYFFLLLLSLFLFLLFFCVCFCLFGKRNKTVWEQYSSTLDDDSWFITISGVPLSYPVTITFEKPETLV